MTTAEIIFLSFCLSSGVALAVWARWSRYRFEHEDRRGRPAE